MNTSSSVGSDFVRLRILPPNVCDGWCWWPSTNRCILVAVTTITVVNGNSVVIDNSYCDCLPIIVIGPV